MEPDPRRPVSSASRGKGLARASWMTFLASDVDFLREPAPCRVPSTRTTARCTGGPPDARRASFVDDGYQLSEHRALVPDAIVDLDPAYVRLPRSPRESLVARDVRFQEFLDVSYRRVEGHPPWYARTRPRPGSAVGVLGAR